MPSIRRLGLMALAATPIVPVEGQDPCDPNDDPTCAMAWPPGHHGIGSSYWAVGSPDVMITMAWAALRLPPKGIMNGSAMALNPSLENTVRYPNPRTPALQEAHTLNVPIEH